MDRNARANTRYADQKLHGRSLYSRELNRISDYNIEYNVQRFVHCLEEVMERK